MEFFKTASEIPFMKQRKMAGIFSAILLLGSLIVLCMNGLNLGLDFTGGTEVEVHFSQPVDVNILREKIVQQGFSEAMLQAYSTTEVNVRVAPHKEITPSELRERILQALPGGTIDQMNYIGPQVGQTLMSNGILAILVSLIGTMIYIALRFEYRFAVSAAIALIHDPLLILGIFSLFHLEFNLIVLAAVLTVIGYSLNDTIVVYDRVRENFRKQRKRTALEVMDLSINQTLSRTIMTSGLTLLVVIALFIWGGAMIHNFALALMIGIVVGTYSSIYVAGSLAIAFGLTRKSLLPDKRPIEDALP
ncbi:MAG TPA: protein translocase subunit SecF [Coxiellaceae bacterium]|nr:protein translocase subunit SecF [Coxiellaceae bacterium]